MATVTNRSITAYVAGTASCIKETGARSTCADATINKSSISASMPTVIHRSIIAPVPPTTTNPYTKITRNIFFTKVNIDVANLIVG